MEAISPASSSRPSQAAAHSRMAWLLLAAFLPQLLFVGHWTIPLVPIPGTSVSVGFAAPAPSGDAHTHDHAAHCHADAAGCSDAPSFSGVSVAALGSLIALIGAAGLMVLVRRANTHIPPGHTLEPGLHPPRPASFALS